MIAIFKILFLPDRKEVTVKEGTDLLSAAALAGCTIEGTCGGKGTCGKCRVQLVDGLNEAPNPLETKYIPNDKLVEGWGLACQRKVRQDTIVKTVAETVNQSRKTELNFRNVAVKQDPVIKKIVVKPEKPTREDQASDMGRIIEKLPVKNISFNLRELAAVPEILRRENFLITAVLHGRRLIAFESGDTSGKLYALAFDIGTTTVMGSLIDLLSGEVLDELALTNQQNIYGADVISRIIHASSQGGGLKQLQNKVMSVLNEIIKTLIGRTGVRHDQIYEAVLVGNTAMAHLFLGVNPAYLAHSPYVPVFKESVEVGAAELGMFMSPGARVTVLPNLAGFVGSDTVGMILVTNLDKKKKNILAIDIGTNGELVLAAGGRLLACSTAAGPAFEGANIRHGMRAAQGAIESVVIEDDIRIKTVGDVPARGICGSGLIDAVSELLKIGLVEPSGRFTDPMKKDLSLVADPLLKRLRLNAKVYEFVLVYGEKSDHGEDIVISQKDLRELQLAKGAIYSGIKILLAEAGISTEDLDRILLAGAFGNYLQTESALNIGLLPKIDAGRIISVGNAAGDGAKIALISGKMRKRANKIRERVEHVELSNRKDFQKTLISSLSFMVSEHE